MSPSVGRYRAAVSVVCLLFANCAGALCQQVMVHATGTVVVQGGGSSTGLTAELCDALDDQVTSRATVSASGEFDFGMVAAGQYKLQITGWGDSVLARRIVSVDSNRQPIEVRLSGPVQTPRGSTRVSLARLKHKIPRRAARELRREAEAFRAGDLEGSIAHLQRAIEIDPDCTEAHNNLGVRYMSQKKIQAATAEFRTATVLDPEADGPFTNLATALFLAGQREEAEAAARRAIALNPASARAHYMLGESLVMEGKSEDAAVREFERAAPEIPAARLAAAQVLTTLGEPKPAAEQLRLYLGTENPQNRAMVQDWLAKLTEAGR